MKAPVYIQVSTMTIPGLDHDLRSAALLFYRTSCLNPPHRKATMGMLINRGTYDIPIKWHQAAAGLTIIVAIIQGIIVMWAFFF